MARVKSYLRLRGSVGESTFVKQKLAKGYRVQDKLETTPGNFKTNPKLARVRENANDFGTAARGGKLIRNSVSSLIADARDRSLTSRMLKALMEVVKSDVTSPAGKGNLIDGNLALLTDFPFNASANLKGTLKADVTHNINRVTGQLTIDVPVFNPSLSLKAPSSTTHYQFVSGGAELDFELGTFKTDPQKSAELPLNSVATVAVTLTHAVTANSTKPLFLVFGVRFFRQHGTEMLPLLKADSSVMVILAVSKV